MKRLWERYYFCELIKVFLLFMTSFYFLYVLIDYSTHTKVFHDFGIGLFSTLLYYALQFTKRADILIPIALMIASITVLTTSNHRNEILALATSGISLKKILSPFLWAATLCTLFLYANYQFLQPHSLGWIDSFESRYFHGRNGNEEVGVKSLLLEDKSLLLYQSFDHSTQSFFDVYWLKNGQSIYRIQSLFPYEKTPLGREVDVLEKNGVGEWVKAGSYEQLTFPGITIAPKTLFHALFPPPMQSMTQLARGMGGVGMGKMSDREAEIATYFYFKLTMPLLCFLAIIGPASFALRFTRNRVVFPIFALSLFFIITFFTLVKSGLVLGESQIIAPPFAIVLPQIPFFLVLLSKYVRL